MIGTTKISLLPAKVNKKTNQLLTNHLDPSFYAVHFVAVLHVFFGAVKGHLLCKIHFYMLFEQKYVLAACVHNHPIMINIHQLIFPP